MVVFMLKSLLRAIAIAGSQQALADRIGKQQSYVSMMLHRLRHRDDFRINPEICPRIEAATGGLVTRSDLRPDLWPVEPKRRKADQQQEAA